MILITGAAGFIGSTLAQKLLDMDYSIIGIDCFTDYYPEELKRTNINPLLEYKNFTFIEEDLSEIDLHKILSGVKTVYHMAAQPGVRKSWGENFRIYQKNNIEITQKLLEASIGTNIEKFVYSSSSSIYGDTEAMPTHEETIPRPISPYGVSKLACEHLSYLYWKNYNVPTVNLRYFTVYGEKQRPDMAFNKFIKAILKKEEINIFGDGNQTRDFTYVQDVVQANIKLLENNTVIGETFNIGGGSRVTVNHVINLLERIIGIKPLVRYSGKEKGDVHDTSADIFKAESVFGYSPKYSLEQGLENEFKWIKKSENF